MSPPQSSAITHNSTFYTEAHVPYRSTSSPPSNPLSIVTSSYNVMRYGDTYNKSVSRSRLLPPSSHAILSRCVIILFVSWMIPARAFQGLIQCRSSLTHRSSYSSNRSCRILSERIITRWMLPIHASHSTQICMSSDDVSSGNSAEDIIESTPSVIELPTIRQLLLFIITTVLVWTSEPLLSIVDSATVGSFANKVKQSGIPSSLASVVQLAALGPATTLCDSSIFLTYFIGMAATNKLARASAKNDWKSMIEISSYS